MGASNFGSSNASAIFAVLMNEDVNYKQCEECLHRHYDYEYDLDTLSFCANGCEEPTFEEDTEYRCPEDFDVENFFDYLEENIQRGSGKFKCNWYGHRDWNCIFELQLDKNFGDINVDVRVIGTMQSGYYEGAKLDWRIECNDNDNTDDLTDDFHWSDMSVGLQTIQARNAEKWASKVSLEMIEAIEKVYTEVSTPLIRLGGFSDGTSLYEKINK